jgi:DNA-binding winged helix-turn-helix (wHTH) protein
VDSELTAAARALDAGDVLGALSRVALRDDAPGLALRGVALSRLGKRDRARELLRSAAKAFGSSAPLGRARCLLAEAEIALASRDLRGVDSALARASRDLRALGDPSNALHADCLAARSLLLRGLLTRAERALHALEIGRASWSLRAEIYLAWVELHVRTANANAARAALNEAARAARRARIPAISQEVQAARRLLEAPAGRLIQGGTERLLGLSQVESVQRAARGLLIDARESSVHAGQVRISLKGRAVLFGLLRVLAEAWPEEVTRRELLTRVFAVTRANDSHRARLRVEIARLRRVLRPLATIVATPAGFRLAVSVADDVDVRVLLPVSESEHAQLLTLLGDGEAWSSSALATALGINQRTVQRSLVTLEAAGRTRATGRARAKRWFLAPPSEFATPLLLPGALHLV